MLFLFAGEMIASTDGLAYRIALLRRHMGMDVIIPYVLWVALLLFLVDFGMRGAQSQTASLVSRRHDAMALIRIEDVFVAYGTPSRAVLAGIDLDIEEGEFVCLLGQTGCGKSRCCGWCWAAEQPMRGRVLIDGSEHPQPDRIARLRAAEVLACFPIRRVLDNITFGPEVSEFGLFGRLTPAFFRRRRRIAR